MSELEDAGVLKKIKEVLRERELLVEKARLAIEKNNAAFSYMVEKSGISLESLDSFYRNLSIADKSEIQEMSKKVQKELRRKVLEMPDSPEREWEHPEKEKDVPLDAWLKGSASAAGDKKSPKKRKKRWV